MRFCRRLALTVACLVVLAPSLVRAGEMLVASDLHFDPMTDPALVDRLAAADADAWEGILAPTLSGGLSPYGRDTNWPLLRSAIDAMKSTLDKPDLILIPGDFLAHDYRRKFDAATSDHSDAAYHRFVQTSMAFMALKLHQAFPATPILPTLGNNDDECGDYDVAPDDAFLTGTTDLMRGLAHAGQDFAADWRAYGGYGVTHPTLPNVRLVFLNTVFFSSHWDGACAKSGTNPGSAVMDWLGRTLTAARAAGQKVWLIYHIPPGVDAFSTNRSKAPSCEAKIKPMWNAAYETPFEALMARFADTVTVSIAGHTHMDEFRLIGPAGKPATYVLGTPAISPIFGQNPAFRRVGFTADGDLSEAKTYALTNLATANDAPRWQLEYDFDTEWHARSIGLASLTELHRRIGQDLATRARWERFYSVSHTDNPGSITDASFSAYYCAVGTTSVADYAACYCPETARQAH